MPFYIWTKETLEKEESPERLSHSGVVVLAMHDDASDHNTVRRFASRAEAFEAIKRDYSVKTHVVVHRATADENYQWQERERERFNTGGYIQVPWVCEYGVISETKYHFCHLSIDKRNMVAYTPDSEAGIADRQIRTTPARYLQAFHKDTFTPDKIAKYVADCAAFTDPTGLKFATSLDDVRAVYRNGPSSCMGGPASHTNEYWREDRLDGHRPIDVYSEPSELQVAFYGPIEKPSQRCIVWPAKKFYGRIYGTGPLETLLKVAGYRVGSFSSARIRRINFGRKSVIIPYVDNCGCAKRDPNDKRFLILGEDDDDYIDGQLTRGYSDSADQPIENNDERACNNCGGYYDPLDEGGDSYCGSCTDEVWVCYACDNDQFGVSTRIDDEHYCGSCARSFRTCANPECSASWVERVQFTYSQRQERRDRHQVEYCRGCATCVRYFACCGHVVYDPGNTAACACRQPASQLWIILQ